jgi:hypothetical protein
VNLTDTERNIRMYWNNNPHSPRYYKIHPRGRIAYYHEFTQIYHDPCTLDDFHQYTMSLSRPNDGDDKLDQLDEYRTA